MSNFFRNIFNSLFQNNKFTGTFNNINKIDKAVDKGRRVSISNPSSKRYRSEKDLNGVTVAGDSNFNGYQQTMSPNSKGKESLQLYQQSTAINNITYDPSTETCGVVFTSGPKEYDFKMTPEQFQAFAHADSKGKFCNEVMKKYNRMPGY